MNLHGMRCDRTVAMDTANLPRANLTGKASPTSHAERRQITHRAQGFLCLRHKAPEGDVRCAVLHIPKRTKDVLPPI